MEKIPVGRTIAETYAFAFRQYFSNLGVAWLPLLIFCVVGYYIFLPALGAMTAALGDIAQHARQNPGAPYLPASFGAFLRGLFLFYFVCLLISPVLAVGITKVALKMPRGLPYVYLAIGKRELLVLGGIFLLIALYIGALIVLVVAGGIIGAIIGITIASTSGGHADPATAVATTLTIVRVASLLFYLALFYFFVRLCFLMVPATTVENRFGVWRSWELTRGNFWRSTGVILGTFLPLTIVFYAIWFVIAGPAMFQYMWNSQTHPELAASNLAAMTQALTGHLVYFAIYLFAVSPISYGLMFGQSAFAYRAIAGDKAAGPWGK